MGEGREGPPRGIGDEVGEPLEGGAGAVEIEGGGGSALETRPERGDEVGGGGTGGVVDPAVGNGLSDCAGEMALRGKGVNLCALGDGFRAECGPEGGASELEGGGDGDGCRGEGNPWDGVGVRARGPDRRERRVDDGWGRLSLYRCRSDEAGET